MASKRWFPRSYLLIKVRYKTKGIVLRSFNYGESSVISRIYTQLFGLQSFIVNSVRKKGAKIPYGLLQPLTELEMEIYHRETRDLQRLAEARAFPIRTNLTNDPRRSAAAMFMAELLLNSIHGEEADDQLFSFCSHAAEIIENEEPSFELLSVLLLNCSKVLGFAPVKEDANVGEYFDLQAGAFTLHQSECTSGVEVSAALRKLINGKTWEASSRALGESVLEALISYTSYHIQSFRPPKSMRLLKSIL